MRIKITRFNIHKTALAIAVIAVIVSLCYFILVALIWAFSTAPDTFSSESRFSVSSITLPLLMPLFYGFITYVTALVSLWIYNQLAAKVGNIEFDIEKIDL